MPIPGVLFVDAADFFTAATLLLAMRSSVTNIWHSTAGLSATAMTNSMMSKQDLSTGSRVKMAHAVATTLLLANPRLQKRVLGRLSRMPMLRVHRVSGKICTNPPPPS